MKILIRTWQDTTGWRGTLAFDDGLPWKGFGVHGFASEREAYDAAVAKIYAKHPNGVAVEPWPSFDEREAAKLKRWEEYKARRIKEFRERHPELAMGDRS